jgi:ketosteroid isomerase-like protein
MGGVLRDFAQELERAAEARCAERERDGSACAEPLCRVAELHGALARRAWDEVAAALTPDAEVEYFGVRLPGFARLARGAAAAVDLLRTNDGAMRWDAVELESATSLGDTLVLFRRERGRWSPGESRHAAVVVTHFVLRDGRIARIRARAFAHGSVPAGSQEAGPG